MNMRPTIHISENLKMLMQVFHGSMAVICEWTTDIDKPTYVSKHLVNQYPSLMQGECNLPFLFDPNFRRYIDVDIAKGNFVIKHVDKRFEKFEKIIPKTLLSTDLNFGGEELEDLKNVS